VNVRRRIAAAAIKKARAFKSILSVEFSGYT